MPPHLDSPLPTAAVRDLLGLVRALYGACKREGGGERRLAELRQVGEDLRAALELARKTPVGSLGHRSAWTRAERATEKLGMLVDSLTPLLPTVTAAVDRIRTAHASASRTDKLR